MIQERPLIEVPFVTAGKETHIPVACLRPVFFANKPVGLMHNAVIRQHLDRFYPGGVYGFIFRAGYSKQLR